MSPQGRVSSGGRSRAANLDIKRVDVMILLIRMLKSCRSYTLQYKRPHLRLTGNASGEGNSGSSDDPSGSAAGLPRRSSLAIFRS